MGNDKYFHKYNDDPECDCGLRNYINYHKYVTGKYTHNTDCAIIYNNYVKGKAYECSCGLDKYKGNLSDNDKLTKI